MRSIATFGALAVLAAAPLAAQGNFRTGGIDPTRRTPTSTSTGSVLGDVIGTRRDTAQRHRKSDHIPPGQMPPAGMCRVWIDGVPPGQQPAPTDCQTAVATKPANARVIFGGDGTSFPGKGNGKLKKAKSGKHGASGDDRDDGDDDDFDTRRDASRSRGSSLAKRGKKG